MKEPPDHLAAPSTFEVGAVKSGQRRLRRRWTVLLLLAPGGGYLLFFFGYPLLSAVLSSIGLFTLGQKSQLTFQHYVDLFANPVYRDGLAITIYIAFAATFISLVLSIGFALLLQRTFPGRRFFRRTLQDPAGGSGIVAGFIVLTLLDRGGMAQRMGSARIRPSSDGARFLCGRRADCDFLEKHPFATIIVGASLGGISEGSDPCRRTLGARPLRVLLSIQIPLALPGITAATLLVFISAMGAFAIPNMLGPVYPLPLSIQMYQEGFVKNEWGLVGSMGTLIMVVSCLVLLGYYRVTRSLRRFQGEAAL
jgi:putative spermidine/putrescine transport system permease protein